MDMEFLKGNLKTAIRMMPPEMQLDFSKLWTGVEKHLPTFEKMGGSVWELMSGDVMTLVMEFSAGVLDKEQLSKIFREAFAECGIGLPDEPKAR